MKQFYLFLIGAWAAVGSAFAQDAVVPQPLNTGAANFLTLPTDARSAAMAGTGTALSGNNHAIFHNGATVFGSEPVSGGISYTYSPWMHDFQSGYQLHTVGGFYQLNSRHAVMGGFRYLGYPSLSGTDDVKVQPKEWAVEAGYAYQLLEGLSVSATARYIYSSMGKLNQADGASTVAFDLGVFYHRSFADKECGEWSVGVQAANFGPKISYASGDAELPSLLKAGGAVQLPFGLVHRVALTADVAYRLLPSDVSAVSVAAGAEYSLLDLLFLRGGYHYGDKEKADYSYGTAGAGLAIYGAQVDFSWLFAGKDCAFRNSWWVTLGYAF